MTLSKTDVVIQNALVSYLNCWQPKETPSGDMKYSVSVLVAQTDKQAKAAIDAAIEAAIAKGIEINKFTKAQVPSLRKPIRNGTTEHESGDRGPEYNGKWFINANSSKQPGIVELVNGTPSPILDEDRLYSGCICHVHVSMFPYNTAGNRGIGAGFQNIMLVSQGDRLDGRISAADAFSEFAANDGSEDDSPF